MRTMNEESVLLQLKEPNVLPDSRCGILIFSGTTQWLYMNPRALELTRGLSKPAPVENGTGDLSVWYEIIMLRRQVQETLQHHLRANVGEPLELKHLYFTASRKVLLHGFALPDQISITRSRIVITIEEVTHEQEPNSQEDERLTGSAGKEEPLYVGPATPLVHENLRPCA
jgi:hypothetical protein